MYTKDANGNKKQITTNKSYGSIEGYKLGASGSGNKSENSILDWLVPRLAIGVVIFVVLIILIVLGLFLYMRKKSN